MRVQSVLCVLKTISASSPALFAGFGAMAGSRRKLARPRTSAPASGVGSPIAVAHGHGSVRLMRDVHLDRTGEPITARPLVPVSNCGPDIADPLRLAQRRIERSVDHRVHLEREGEVPADARRARPRSTCTSRPRHRRIGTRHRRFLQRAAIHRCRQRGARIGRRIAGRAIAREPGAGSADKRTSFDRALVHVPHAATVCLRKSPPNRAKNAGDRPRLVQMVNGLFSPCPRTRYSAGRDSLGDPTHPRGLEQANRHRHRPRHDELVRRDRRGRHARRSSRTAAATRRRRRWSRSTEAGKRLVGHIAKRQAITNAENTVYAAKRLIGRKWNSPQVKNALETVAVPHRRGPARRRAHRAARQGVLASPRSAR